MSALLSGVVLQGFQEFILFMAVPSRATSRHKQETVGMQNSVEWNSDKMRQVVIFIGMRYHLLKFHFCRSSYHLTVVSMSRPLFKVWMVTWWAAVPRSRPSQLIWSLAGELDGLPKHRSWQRATTDMQEAAAQCQMVLEALLQGPCWN